jgi:uncharacterized protein (TIGR02996 family)
VNEDSFLQAICAGHQADTYRVFADWLEEQADPRAEYVRVRGEMAGICGDDPRYHEIVQRLQGKKALAETNPRYRGLAQREKELHQHLADTLAPWQRRFCVERIKRLLRLKRADFDMDEDDFDDEEGDGRIWPFQPRRRLTEKRLLAWEKKHAVSLPEAYQMFLREIGNGGEMPGNWACNLSIYPLDEVEVTETVHTPFPLTSEHARMLRDRNFDRKKCKDPVLRAFLAADFDESPPGTLTVGIPNADYRAPALLIVTGEQRGKMWAARGGWLPECFGNQQLDFLAWFEHLLDLDTY